LEGGANPVNEGRGDMKVLYAVIICVSLVCIAIHGLAESDKLCRTWVNTAYASPERPQKLIFNYDGTFETYPTTASMDPLMRGVYQIVEKWEDSKGVGWYKIKMIDMYGTTYQLAKVDKEGDRLELVRRPDGYPLVIEADMPDYCVYTRRSIE
jgi:hypothetical protein